MRILIICTSGKTSYNVLRYSSDCHNLGTGSICGGLLTFEGGGRRDRARDSVSSFRSLEVCISVTVAVRFVFV